MDDITVFRIGVPGPPGTGVTAAELLQIQNDLSSLKTGTFRGRPIQRGRALQSSFVGNSTGGSSLPAFAATYDTGIDTTKAHRIVGRGWSKVTTTVDEMVEMGLLLATSSGATVVPIDLYATAGVTPTGAGSYTLKFYGSWDVAAGATSLSVGVWYRTSIATNFTATECEIDVTFTPQT